MKAATSLTLASIIATGLAFPSSSEVTSWDDKELLRDQPFSASMADLKAMKLKEWKVMEADGMFDAGRYQVQGKTKCVNGKAGAFSCSGLDLNHFLPHGEMGSAVRKGNDVWGWTSKDGREFGAVCQVDGTAFVELDKDGHMTYLGRLPTQTENSGWRDAKLIGDHMYIGSEAKDHGLQIFDMKKLLGLDGHRPRVFDIKSDISHFAGFGSSHNIVSNPATNTIFAVGTSRMAKCKGGLWMVDVKDPENPKDAGCVAEDGYVHDAQCVMYEGPHKAYKGREICFNFNEDTLTIVDVTNRAAPKQLSRTGYTGSTYTHQGWIVDKEQRFVALDDELDEARNNGPGYGGRTVTYLVDVSDLTNPKFTGEYKSPAKSIDHNLYVIDGIAYESNYGSGLRVVDMNTIKDDPSGQGFLEIAHFDVHPEDDKEGGKVSFNGAWSVYPYFKSGNILINSIERGVFSVRRSG